MKTAIVNSSDIFNSPGMILSAEYHTNKVEGKYPYVIKNNIPVKWDQKQSLPKNAIYLTAAKARLLKVIGKRMNELQKTHNRLTQ